MDAIRTPTASSEEGHLDRRGDEPPVGVCFTRDFPDKARVDWNIPTNSFTVGTEGILDFLLSGWPAGDFVGPSRKVGVQTPDFTDFIDVVDITDVRRDMEAPPCGI
jgi:hypothetical protein